MIKPAVVCVAIALATPVACSADRGPETAGSSARRPNVLLLVADDLGYSDPGFMGSEIRTPNLDALAAEGTVLTDFHVSPACSPTRAMLLTGVDPHLAGLGTMAGEADVNQQGQPGYEGVLSAGVVTIPRLLADAGYLTAISGKWHLGGEDDQRPEARGFQRSFVLIPGGASHFADRQRLGADETPAPYREDGRPADLPPGFYSTDFYTDKLIEYLGEAHDRDLPFYAIAAFTAPHWPLQATNGYIDRYRGAYDEGWDALLSRRLAGLRRTGLISTEIGPPAPAPFIRAWSDLSAAERRVEAREMELFAAMVENLDHNVGRLLGFLADVGELDRTFVMFFSDNGAEGNPIEEADWTWKGYDNSFENLGRAGSYVAYDAGWARAATAPFRLFKTFPTEGGTRVPAVVRLPRGQSTDGFGAAFASVKDVAATALELAGVSHPGPSFHGRSVAPIEGASMLAYLRGEAAEIHPPDFVAGAELFGRRSLRQGDWKLLWLWEPYGAERWEMFDLSRDPTESTDLAAHEPERLQRMVASWNAYARRNGVVLPARDTSYARVRGDRASQERPGKSPGGG